MSTLFIDYFSPRNDYHLQWVRHLCQYHTWPQAMYDDLDLAGVEYPQPADAVGVLIEIAKFHLGIR